MYNTILTYIWTYIFGLLKYPIVYVQKSPRALKINIFMTLSEKRQAK